MTAKGTVASTATATLLSFSSTDLLVVSRCLVHALQFHNDLARRGDVGMHLSKYLENSAKLQLLNVTLFQNGSTCAFQHLANDVWPRQQREGWFNGGPGSAGFLGNLKDWDQPIWRTQPGRGRHLHIVDPSIHLLACTLDRKYMMNHASSCQWLTTIYLAIGSFKPRKHPYPQYPSIQQATEKWNKWEKWGEMGGNWGKWGEMGENEGK